MSERRRSRSRSLDAGTGGTQNGSYGSGPKGTLISDTGMALLRRRQDEQVTRLRQQEMQIEQQQQQIQQQQHQLQQQTEQIQQQQHQLQQQTEQIQQLQQQQLGATTTAASTAASSAAASEELFGDMLGEWAECFKK